MLSIGDKVLHPKTGQTGQVFGYGHLMKNGRFISTLIVRISNRKGTRRHSKFLEDKHSHWVLLKT